LPQNQVQLPGVVLEVTHGVQEQLSKGEFPPWERAAAPRRIVGERFDRGMAFFRQVQFTQGKWRRRRAFSRARKVQIEEKERVTRNISEFLLPGLIGPLLLGDRRA
jgi:hypothetical protein